MHVLCAPPAFILSQDQTLLFFTADKLRYTVSSLQNFISMYKRTISIKFLRLSLSNLFLLVKHSHVLLSFEFLTHSFQFKLFWQYFCITAWSLKGYYCLLFNVLFMFRPILTERFSLYYLLKQLSTYFLIFF